MAFDRFLIAPINSGLQTNLKPWLINDDAYAVLRNAYVFRGRTRKRFGSQLMGSNIPTFAQLQSRARILVATTDGLGNASGTVPGSVFAIGQMFSIGNELFTVYQTGTPANMFDTGSSTVHTYNTTNGAYVINGAAPLTAVFFYPAQPIMGLCNYELGPVDNQPSIAFDTQFAYEYSSGWFRLGVGVLPVWHGTDSQFFWTFNYLGINPGEVSLFVTNFNATVGAPGVNDDPIWAYSAQFTPNSWINFSDYTRFNSSGAFVATARIIVAFKNRLLLLNTIENDNAMAPTNTAFPQRLRYSASGSPFASGAWLQPNQTYMGATYSGAGFIDAPTEEIIVSVEFIKDRLIVFFERSTWEIAYTGNQVLPFVWQKINTELGCESTFSSIPFDDQILAIGNTGVHACSGTTVQRIDLKIPDEVFQINSITTNIERVYGIRDYYVECVYWTFPSDNAQSTQKYPNRILLYNYRNDSWAFNDDTITAFGYFEQEQDFTWETMGDWTWEEANFEWNSGIQQSTSRQVIAGNQEGFIVLIQPDIARNAPSLQITNMTQINASQVLISVINHNLTTDDFVLLENALGITGLNNAIYSIAAVSQNSITLNNATFTGSYTGGGTLSRVSRIDILSKQYNVYVQQDRNMYLHKIDFCVEKTSAGQITVDYYPSSTELSMITAGQGTGTIMGNNILETSPYALYPLEQAQQRLWHPVYFQTDGQFIQFRMYLSDEQMISVPIALSDFQLEAFTLYTQPTTARLQ
jgi:hypothetical protein